MYHARPTSKKTTANGYDEGYKFGDISTIGLTRLTYSGGFDNINTTKDDRIFIVEKGSGFATILGKTVELQEGSVLEVPAGHSVELSSAQIIFYVVSATK